MKTYNLEGLEYGFRRVNSKWAFSIGGYQFLTRCNGVETAHNVAKQVLGGVRRTKGKGLDGLARNQIQSLTA